MGLLDPATSLDGIYDLFILDKTLAERAVPSPTGLGSSQAGPARTATTSAARAAARLTAT